MRTETVREEIKNFLQRRPFAPFVVSLESGGGILIEHPENIAYNPVADPATAPGGRLVIVAGEYSMFTTFDAVTSMTYRDTGDGSAA